MTHGHGLLRIGDGTKNATLLFDNRHTVILQRKNPIVHLIVTMRLFDSFMLGPRCSLHSSHVGTIFGYYQYCMFNHSYLLHLSTCVSQTQATSVGSILPTACVSPDVVFDKVGIDYAEPINIKYMCISLPLSKHTSLSFS